MFTGSQCYLCALMYPNHLHRVVINDTGFTGNPYPSGAATEVEVRYLSTHKIAWNIQIQATESQSLCPQWTAVSPLNLTCPCHSGVFTAWHWGCLSIAWESLRAYLFSALQHKDHWDSVGRLCRVEGTHMYLVPWSKLPLAPQLAWREVYNSRRVVKRRNTHCSGCDPGPGFWWWTLDHSYLTVWMQP